MMKTSRTFYTTDSRQVFKQGITDKHVFMVDVFVVSISPLMTPMCVLFVLFCFTLSCPGIGQKQRLTKIVCYDILGPAFFGGQPTESRYDMTLFLSKILKEGVVV